MQYLALNKGRNYYRNTKNCTKRYSYLIY